MNGVFKKNRIFIKKEIKVGVKKSDISKAIQLRFNGTTECGLKGLNFSVETIEKTRKLLNSTNYLVCNFLSKPPISDGELKSLNFPDYVIHAARSIAKDVMCATRIILEYPKSFFKKLSAHGLYGLTVLTAQDFVLKIDLFSFKMQALYLFSIGTKSPPCKPKTFIDWGKIIGYLMFLQDKGGLDAVMEKEKYPQWIVNVAKRRYKLEKRIDQALKKNKKKNNMLCVDQ